MHWRKAWWLIPLSGVAWLMARSGLYGWTLFFVAPFLLGVVGVVITRPPTVLTAGWIGMSFAAMGLPFFLLLGAEGLICAVMTLPLALPLGWAGGAWWHEYSVRRQKRTTTTLVLLPLLTLGWDFNATPETYEVRSSIEISATPEQVWQQIVTFDDIPEPTEWYFKTGLAYPVRARIDGSGVGSVRYCDFSTGPVVEPIEIWDEPRLLQFRVTENPAPMEEMSPWGHIEPKHLHGYMESERGQFKLTPLPGGRTLLEGTSWYRHGLWPGQYWRWWSDAIIHRVHMRVFTHIKGLAEAR